MDTSRHTMQSILLCLITFVLVSWVNVSVFAQSVALTTVTPADEEYVPTSNPTLLLDFSGHIDPATATADSVRLYKLGDDSFIPGPDDTQILLTNITLENGNTRIVATPDSPLQDGEYAVVIYGSDSDRSGPGYGLYFSGHVAYHDLDAFKTLTNTYTLEAWVRYDDWASYGSHTFGSIFDFGKAGREVPGVRVFHNADMIIYDQRELDGTTRHFLEAPGALAKGEWRHVTAVSSDEGMKLYIDGELVAQNDVSYSIANMAHTFEVALMGYSRWAGSYDYVLGMFDEMRVWNIARTEEQIRATMHTPLVGNEPGLLLYHPLDQTEGDVLLDVSGNGYDGDRNNALRQPSDAPLIEMAAQGLRAENGVPVDTDGDGEWGGVLVSAFTVDTTGPQVVDMQPDLTETFLDQVVDNIAISFDDAMAAATIITDNVELLASGNGVFDDGDDMVIVPAGVMHDEDNNAMTIDLAAALASGTYRLTIGDAVTNSVDIALDGEYPGLGSVDEPLPSGDGIAGGNFVIEFSIDTPPQVTSMIPAPGSKSKDVNEVSVTFSELIDPDTIHETTFRLVADGPDNALGTTDDVVVIPAAGTPVLDPDGQTALYITDEWLTSDRYYVLLDSVAKNKDDFTYGVDISTWQLNGSARWESQGLVTVVPEASNQMGSIFWKQYVLINTFTAEFDFRIGTEGGSGDGFTFAFWEHTSPNILGHYGYGLGLDEAPGRGYAVEFDTYRNSGYDSNDNHVAVITQPTALPLSEAVPPADLNTQSSYWHAEVQFTNGHVQVWLSNNELSIDETLVIDHVIDGFEPYLGYIGFTAGTGTSRSPVTIDNVVIDVDQYELQGIRDSAGVPLDGEFSGAFPSGDGVASGSFIASFEVDRTPPRISDTEPEDNQVENDPNRQGFTFWFSEQMDCDTLLNPDAYTVMHNGRTIMPIERIDCDEMGTYVQLTINESGSLEDGVYHVQVDGDLLTDVSGNLLDGDEDGQEGGMFELYTVRDTAAPRIVMTDPAAYSVTEWGQVYFLTIYFDSAVDQASAENTATYHLIGSGGDCDMYTGNEYYVSVDGAWYDPADHSVLLMVNYGFTLPEDKYQLNVLSQYTNVYNPEGYYPPYGIIDLAGNALDGDDDAIPGGTFETYFRIGAALEGDINFDCRVNLEDYATLSNHWPRNDCDAPSWCDGADLDHNGYVDHGDYQAVHDAWTDCAAWNCLP